MKIKMKRDAHHRISSSKSQRYREGREYEVPKATGEALVKREDAVAVSGKDTGDKE